MATTPEKPVVFISHAVTDQPIVKVIHDEIKRIFAGGVEVFATSVPGVLSPGEKWLDSINEGLGKASAVIVVITPVSINRPWIWFEVGASWSRMEDGEGKILPLCVPEVDKADLPEPLSRLQAMSLGVAAETRLVFQALIDQFGIGSLKGYRHSSIKAKLPRYNDLVVSETDLRAGAVYSGPYEGYSDDEFEEVIDSGLLEPAWDDAFKSWGSSVFQGELLHFRALDDRFQLPPGTAKRLAVKAAVDRYYVVPVESQNTVRFMVDKKALNAAGA